MLGAAEIEPNNIGQIFEDCLDGGPVTRQSVLAFGLSLIESAIDGLDYSARREIVDMISAALLEQ